MREQLECLHLEPCAAALAEPPLRESAVEESAANIDESLFTAAVNSEFSARARVRVPRGRS